MIASADYTTAQEQRVKTVLAQLESLRAERAYARAHLAAVAGLLGLPLDQVAPTVMAMHLDSLEVDERIAWLEGCLRDLQDSARGIRVLPPLTGPRPPARLDPYDLGRLVPPTAPRPGLWCRLSETFKGWIAP